MKTIYSLSYENFTKSLQLIKETGLGDFEQSGDQKDAVWFLIHELKY